LSGGSEVVALTQEKRSMEEIVAGLTPRSKIRFSEKLLLLV